jgi:hypothetical protein
MAGHTVGPRHRCAVCSRALCDSQSIARGVGSECWQGVMDDLHKQGQRDQ